MGSLTADLSLPGQSPNEWDRLPDCVFIGQSLKEHDTLITGQRRQSEFVNRELQRIKKSDHKAQLHQCGSLLTSLLSRWHMKVFNVTGAEFLAKYFEGRVCRGLPGQP